MKTTPKGATHCTSTYGIESFFSYREYQARTLDCDAHSCWHSWDERSQSWVKEFSVNTDKLHKL